MKDVHWKLTSKLILLRPDINKIKRFEECSGVSFIGNWLVIDAASSLTFTPKERTEFNLQSLPYPFIVNGRWNDTTVVIGDEVDGKVLSSLLTVIGVIGRDAYNSTELRFVAFDRG